MDREIFDFEGYQIKPEILSRAWEETRATLSGTYPVENIPMPKTSGLIMKEKAFERALSRLFHSSHIEDTRTEEYGNCAVTGSACVFFSDVNQEWIILKCKGRNSLEADLNHELFHIWEHVLNLKCGTLAPKGTS